MTQIALEPATPQPIFRPRLSRFTIVDLVIRGLWKVESWRLRHKASMQCKRVETRFLRDIGISDAQRFIEVNKPFWKD